MGAPWLIKHMYAKPAKDRLVESLARAIYCFFSTCVGGGLWHLSKGAITAGVFEVMFIVCGSYFLFLLGIIRNNWREYRLAIVRDIMES